MQRPTSIIPIVGVQYAANSKSIAPQKEAERDAHTLALLNRLQTAGGRGMLIPEPSNRHNPNAILARLNAARGLIECPKATALART